jgi:hypothetical protein
MVNNKAFLNLISYSIGLQVNMGGTVPQSFYLKGSNLVDADKISKAVIRAGNAYQAEYEVYKEGQVLK